MVVAMRLKGAHPTAIAVLFTLLVLAVRPPNLPAAEPSGAATLSVDLAGSYNPEGLQLSVGAIVQREFGRDPGNGLPSSSLEGGLTAAASPAYGQFAVHVEWMPALFLQLRLQAKYYRFFGQYGALLSFPDADSPFGKEETDAREGTEEEAGGGRILFRPTLRFKVGPVIIRNQADAAWYRFGGRGPFFLDWEYNTLLADNDWVLADRLQLLYPAWRGSGDASLLLGPFYEVVHAMDANLTRQRLGGLLVWVPKSSLGAIKSPRLYLQAGVNLEDPNREGELWIEGGIGFDLGL